MLLEAMRARLASLAPMLSLMMGALQQQALRAVSLHKATVKLAYISSSIFATLLQDGYCAPQEEGKGVEGELCGVMQVLLLKQHAPLLLPQCRSSSLHQSDARDTHCPGAQHDLLQQLHVAECGRLKDHYVAPGTTLATAGGDGQGEFKEVSGTGMGEGDTRGAKVSRHMMKAPVQGAGLVPPEWHLGPVKKC
jgi:hypothetical protein